MARILNDVEIADLLSEKKPLPQKWRSRVTVREKQNLSYRQRELEIMGEKGSLFRLVFRRNTLNSLDFSIILVFIDSEESEYRLIRHNGRHSEHTNKWEKKHNRSNIRFRNRFHIHRATERYQVEFGAENIDGYAEVTDKYGSFETALDLFIREYGFQDPTQEIQDTNQGQLF